MIETRTAPTIVIRGKVFTLATGSHQPNGHACIMEIAAYLRNEPWSDHPKCASPVITAYCIALWDRDRRYWPGLLARLDRIAGSASPELDKARGYLAADRAVRVFAPRWLRASGMDDDALLLEALLPIVDAKSARAANDVSYSVRQRVWKVRDAAWEKAAASAAAAAAAASAYAAYAAASAAAYAYAAYAAFPPKLTYSQRVAWFRKRIDAALALHLEAAMADVLTLLDDMLAIGGTR